MASPCCPSEQWPEALRLSGRPTAEEVQGSYLPGSETGLEFKQEVFSGSWFRVLGLGFRGYRAQVCRYWVRLDVGLQHQRNRLVCLPWTPARSALQDLQVEAADLKMVQDYWEGEGEA